jgi:hypothetical protein
MPIRRNAISAAFAAGLASLPLSTANAQSYPPCSPFPLSWPFCVAGPVVAAATIVTAPFWALTGAAPPPYYYYGYSGKPYYPPGYYLPGYYAPTHYYGPRPAGPPGGAGTG